MTTRVTLNIERELLEFAQSQAEKQKTTLSDLISDMIKEKVQMKKKKLALDEFNKLRFEVEDISVEEARTEYLKKKYGK
ncbi:MAG: hypothetical protein DSY77_11070 [Bacteroidetes bacterium]|nr:MAG: hypothetical protein DSY77_11070 [Bacteroidota bacterium]